MYHQADRRVPQSLIRLFISHLLLAHLCKGQSQLISPPRSVPAGVGDDVILPCHLEPVSDATAETVEWTKSDLDPRFVHVRRSGQDLVNMQNPQYRRRTSMFPGELKHGNISLKLSSVQLSDEGIYECGIPLMTKRSSVKLVVVSDTVASPAVSLAGQSRAGVVLQCNSTGWYPEPEMIWLDSKGNLLSAGPTETVQGDDGLYNVSSRVTVEKRHSNSFTCRVTQKKTNQTREDEIIILDDFFEVESSSSYSTVGLAVGLVVSILIILLLVFFVWRQNKTRTNRSHKTKGKDSSKHSKAAAGSVSEEGGDGQQLMTNEQPQIRLEQLQEEQTRRQEAENKVKTLEEELETKTKEAEKKQADLQQLREEKQRNEAELHELKKELEEKGKELDELQKAKSSWFSWGSPQKTDAERQVEKLRIELETQKKESGERIQQLQEENNTLKTQLKQTKDELTEARGQLNEKDTKINQLSDKLVKQLSDKQQKETNEKEWNEHRMKQTEWEKKHQEKMHHAEKMRREKAEKELEILKKEGQTKQHS